MTDEKINNLIQGIVEDSNEFRKQLPQQVVERDLGPLNEFSRSLLHATLSDETRKAEEERLAKMERKRKGLRERKPYTRKAGCVHPKRKAATERKRQEKKWAEEPLNCINNSWGFWALDEELWEKHIAPLWLKYKPSDMVWKRSKKYNREVGNKQQPHDIYSIVIEHKKLGRLYDGDSQQLYDLSDSSVKHLVQVYPQTSL